MLPNDPMMLLSVVNLKLRDMYPDLDTMCEDMDIDKQSLCDRLAGVDYHYDATSNQFK